MARIGDLGYQATAAALVAQAICAQGRFDEAEAFCRIAQEIGAEDDLATQVIRRGAEAKIPSHGDAAQAADLARAAVELAERTDDLNMIADALMDLADVLSQDRRLGRGGRGASASALALPSEGNIVSAARAANGSSA